MSKDKIKRVMIVMGIMFLVIVAIVGKLVYVQLIQGADMEARALNSRLRELPLKPNRGVIYDRNGSALAISVETNTVYITPSNVRKSERRAETAQKLAEILSMDIDKINEKIDKKSGFEYIKRHVSDEQALALKELKLPGVGFTTEYKRSYPKGSLASHIIGFAGVDNQGLSGLELYYEEELKGKAGKLLIEQDSAHNDIPQSQQEFIPAMSGYSLQLTLDETIQYIAEREVKQVYQEQEARGVTAVVMDIKTGGILAMANAPDFDPNSYGDVAPEVWTNFAVNGLYEPGSTFKIMSSSMFLEEGATKADDHYTCNGYIVIDKHRFKCWRAQPHGDQTFAQGVANSCNPVIAQVVAKLGFAKFYNYLDGFGLTERTGVDLPGEASSLIVPEKKAIDLDLASMSIGQSNAYTPIQVITGISAVANGGKLMAPHIVDSILDAEGNVVEKIQPTVVRQVVSESTAREMWGILENVVATGTGSKGKIEGYRVAGKTGTGQKPAVGGYSKDNFVVSFAGFAPADDPQVAVLVLVDEPKHEKMGGLVAGPVFQRIMADTLRYLEIPPNVLPEAQAAEETATVVMPNLSTMNAMEAISYFIGEGLNPIVETQGAEMYAYLPPAGTEVALGSDVLLYCLTPETGAVTIPDLSGKTIKEADRVINGLGLQLSVQGSGLAYRQSPAAGEVLAPGGLVQVWFATAEEEAEMQALAKELEEAMNQDNKP